jgi:hypothetical protein
MKNFYHELHEPQRTTTRYEIKSSLCSCGSWFILIFFLDNSDNNYKNIINTMKCKFFYIFSALFVFVSVSTFAQTTLFKPFTSFRVIQTGHFDIIFPKESEPSARLLASFADRVYEQVSSLLGIEVHGRIPVTITPHTDSFNGYYNTIFNHIMLFDTPMDVEWTNFKNNIESLFLHELTHAVSMNTSSPAFESFNRIFGNWAMPALIYAPQFMVEGVTVSFESLDGFGRANDPRTKQYLRQAIFENKFLTPFQASGVYDRSISSGSGYWYEYGGLFSAWLQKNYGMEKYSQLWKEMGKLERFTFFVYKSDYYLIFKKVYGVDFLDEWKKFGASFALDGLEINKDELSPKKYDHFSEREYFIGSLTARGNNLYFIESSEDKIGVYDTLTGKTQTFNAASVYDIDVSTDGKKMLLSGYSSIESRGFAVVTEYKTDNGQKTGRSIKGLYKARYFRDGVIGIRSVLHNNCVVIENFNGESEVLFMGNEQLMFSGPQVVDDELIVFITLREGNRELWLFNYVSRELFKIENTQDDNEYWAYTRDLNVSQGKLFFGYNSDDRMYKLGMIDLETMQAVFSGRDFSGGVFNPVSIDDSVYYLASFFSRKSLMRFPESVGSLSGDKINLQLTKLDNKDYKTVSEPPYTGKSKPYNGLGFFNPFKLWFPMPLIREVGDDDIKFDGGGIFSIMMDPIEENIISLLVYTDIPYKMAMIDQFTWQNTGMGFPLKVDISDKVMEESENNIYRYTNITLIGSVNWIMGQWNNQIMLGGGYYRTALLEEGKNAYEWEEALSGFFVTTGFLFSYRRLSLQFNGAVPVFSNANFVNSFEPRLEMIFRASTETRFPLSLTLFGAYDKGGMNLHGVSRIFNTATLDELVLKEYENPADLELLWLAGGEIGIGLFSFEIQKNLSHVYYNKIFGTLSVRNQIYDSGDFPDAEGIEINNLHLIQSLGLKIGIKISFFPIIKTPVSIEPFVFGAWNFTNAITGKGSLFYVNVGVNAAF